MKNFSYDYDQNATGSSRRKSLTWAQFWFVMWLIAMIGLLFPVAEAEDVTLSWTNPTGTEITSPGPAYTNPGGTRIWQLIAEIPDPTQSIDTYTIPALKPGSYDFAATSYDDTGVESRITGKATKVVTDWTVIDTRARIVAKTTNSVILSVVGTVPLGTACDVNIEIRGPVFGDDGITIENRTFYAIDPTSVTYTGVEDVLVVAECG